MTDQEDTLQSRLDFLVPLNKLPPDRQSRLLEQSETLGLKKKQTLFKQGDRDDYTYYVLEGDIEMYADDSLIKSVSGGDAASFQHLAQLQPRQMTAIAKTKLRILRVDRGLLDQLLSVDESKTVDEPDTGVEVEEMESDASGDWLMTMLQSELFSRIPASNIQSLLDTLETVDAKVGENVVSQGEPGDFYYAVQSGACEVVRTGSKNKEVRLAELTAGDTFGEEALISGAKRNATVRMTADGELARLTKEDFTQLIKAPLLSTVNRDEADKLASNGALWLDVRFDDEHKHNGLPKSFNIPLSSLRTRMDELDASLSYIVYCDSGGRSSAADFLLAEKGYNVVHVEGGAVDEPIPDQPEQAPAKKAPAKKAPAKKAAAKKAPAEKAPEKPAPPEQGSSESALEADAHASALAAEVEKAAFTIEQAQKMMAEAEAMKAEAEKIVAEKLASEKQKIEQETVAIRDTLAEEKRKVQQDVDAREQTLEMEKEKLEKEAEALGQTLESEKEKLEQEADALGQTLEMEKERLEQEATDLKAKLAEAEKLKNALAKQQKSAEAEAEKRHKEIDKRLDEVEKDAEAKLTKERKQLESLYEKQAGQLESAQADREAELRAELKEELTSERKKFEAEFARSTEAPEKAREERAAALTAKEAAAEEANQMIAEFKAEQKKILDEQHQAIEAEREKLRTEAERIEMLQKETTKVRNKVRKDAEAAKEEAKRELEKARTHEQSAASDEVDTTIIEIEERAAAADLELEHAIEAESAVATAAKNNEHELDRTYDTADEINGLLNRELTDWVADQEKMQESTLQREVLSKQKEMVERIKARAAAAAADTVNHDKSLLDEIEQQLDGA